MGIVVTVVMFLGLIVVYPFSRPNFRYFKNNHSAQRIIACLLFFVGLWNIFWYSLRYWPSFWAVAALVSGLFMVLAAILVLGKSLSLSPRLSTCTPMAASVTLGLLVCFILYSVTIIQLNMGYAIIR